jgi:hypothetical protein
VRLVEAGFLANKLTASSDIYDAYGADRGLSRPRILIRRRTRAVNSKLTKSITRRAVVTGSSIGAGVARYQSRSTPKIWDKDAPSIIANISIPINRLFVANRLSEPDFPSGVPMNVSNHSTLWSALDSICERMKVAN